MEKLNGTFDNKKDIQANAGTDAQKDSRVL